MTVKELMEILKEQNPDMKVLITVTDPTDYTYKVSIEEIRVGDPYDSNGYSGVTGEELEADEFDEDDQFIGENVLLIDVGTV